MLNVILCNHNQIISPFWVEKKYVPQWRQLWRNALGGANSRDVPTPLRIGNCLFGTIATLSRIILNISAYALYKCEQFYTSWSAIKVLRASILCGFSHFYFMVNSGNYLVVVDANTYWRACKHCRAPAKQRGSETLMMNYRLIWLCSGVYLFR